MARISTSAERIKTRVESDYQLGLGIRPCLTIASSGTSYGIMLLDKTKAHVEVEYTKSKGYQFVTVVIYGDTESVIVKFGTETVKETSPQAIEAAEHCSAIL